MMYQQEIEFFWPLTEQIPLDLDYSECEKPKLYTTMPIINDGTGYTFTVANPGSSCVTISAAGLNIDVDTTKIKVREKPNLCHRFFYKCLGLKWEIK